MGYFFLGLGLIAGGLLIGCGGGGAGSALPGLTTGTTGGGATTGGSSANLFATTFSVDVKTGKVTVASQKGGGMRKPGMFTGNSIAFNSSVLTDVQLETGIKALNVSLTNNSGIPIGVDPNGNVTGLNVIFGSFQNTVGVVDQRPNTNVSTFAGSISGFADGSASLAKLNHVTGVAVGSDGSVYVADFGNNRIRKIAGGYASTLAGNGVAGEVNASGDAAELDGPYGIAFNPASGHLEVTDYSANKIRDVSLTGVVTTLAGTGALGEANGSASSATFTHPAGIAVDSGGNIYVSDAGGNTIRKLSGGTVSTYAGSSAGYVDGPGASAKFATPVGLACDSSGNLYVADSQNNVIRKVDASQNVTTIAGNADAAETDGYGNVAAFNHPFGLAFLNGSLFVTDESGDTIRQVQPIQGGSSGTKSWLVETLAGTVSSAGSTNGSGSSALFNTPFMLAASSQGSLYIADYGNSLIRRINPSSGTFPIGNPNGNTNPTDLVQLSNASGVVPDSDLGTQNPYVTYSGSLQPGQSSVVQPWQFTIPSGVSSFQFQVIVETDTAQSLVLQAAMGAGSPDVDVRTFVGNPNNFGFANGTAFEASFGQPLGVASDAKGVLYVSDNGFAAVRRVTANGDVSTVAGGPSLGPGHADGAGNVAQFNNLEGIAVNQSGDEIFVADRNNNEVRRIALTGSDPTNPADWLVSTIAGSPTGTAGDAEGAGSGASFNAPLGIALSPGGVLYVSELYGNRVRRMTFTGGDRSQAANWYVNLAAGDGTAIGGAAGDVDGSGSAARFDEPDGLACDRAGNVYIADFANNAVRKMDPAGNVNTFAGLGPSRPGYVDGNFASAEFSFPAGVAVDSSGYVYVADQNNYRIRRISPGRVTETVAGSGAATYRDGTGDQAGFSLPTSLAVSPSGGLFVDSVSSAIQVIQTVVSSAASKARPK